MQLGNCWFDDAKGELINRASGDVWHLPRAEAQVLRLLLSQADQVVTKAQLRQGDDEHGELSDSSVARAVFMIRSFLGPGSELLIETVKGQGYRLHLTPIKAPVPAKRRLPSRRLGPVPIWIPALLMLALLFVGGYFALRVGEMSPTAPLKVQSLVQADGQMVKLVLYAHSRSNNTLLLEKAAELATVLGDCRHSRWRDVFMSLSHDSRVLNLTLRGDYLGQAVVRNLKISDGRSPRRFISPDWLKEVDICD
ncbi:winged helix-turn-helix domain-containing protein [Shewanella litorisediminis]|uniref:Helix-turn-helix domain-containing protein n=1 Tax=Shewanella litorisediminis TaxID=1173586 RepID=A0ABX7G154_9GAMM|nr:helix-turn-helix domain-containing protein [Shewanella litorisediminis]MCL2918942.1 helix-turn-helix domain-containing protein [Shewanella litorisediminis]QRH01011.1 helix-turn-helix domain-containing protein [Shewanella litorisediminis]